MCASKNTRAGRPAGHTERLSILSSKPRHAGEQNECHGQVCWDSRREAGLTRTASPEGISCFDRGSSAVGSLRAAEGTTPDTWGATWSHSSSSSSTHLPPEHLPHLLPSPETGWGDALRKPRTPSRGQMLSSCCGEDDRIQPLTVLRYLSRSLCLHCSVILSITVPVPILSSMGMWLSHCLSYD